MTNLKNISARDVLLKKIIATGLYDAERAEEFVGRIEGNDEAMLAIIGRLVLEAERGGSGVQQGIRALVNSSAIPTSLETYNKLLAHELADETFPVVGPGNGDPNP